MTPLCKILVSAVVQGLTEFLPVSSSGHLVLIGHVLGLDSPRVFLEVALHTGTLVSVLIYYRRRILELVVFVVRGDAPARRYVGTLLAACLPAVAVYLLLGDRIERFFDSPRLTCFLLMLTGTVLLTLRFQPSRERPVSLLAGLLIGVAQAFAMLPGISRSGMTVTAGRRLGLNPRKAAEFSMLMAVPLLVGATGVTVLEGICRSGVAMGDLTVPGLLLGGCVSAIVGYVAIAFLVRMLVSGTLWLFGLYCLLVGVAGLLFCR
jgi:undecaprenyl-diphosphatase